MISVRISNLTIFLFLLFISLIIYSSSINGDFLLDDIGQIVSNEYIKQIKTIPLQFITDAFHFYPFNLQDARKYYRPLQSLSFTIDYHIWGLNPFGYHLTNITIHALMGSLIFYFIFALFSDYSLAFLSSILFCVHPIHTEAVSYISGRPELLVSLFTLSSLVFYLVYLKSMSKIKYLLSLFSFILAILSKEAGFLILVPFFILTLGIRAKISKSSLIWHFVSFIGIIVIYVVLRLTVLLPVQTFVKSGYNFLGDILNFSLVLNEYIGLLIFPHNLHLLRTIAPLSSHFYILSSLSLLVSLIIFVIILIKQKKYILLFGISSFILSILYLIRYMYKFSPYVITMEEHWVYFASVGLFIVLAYLILCIKNKKLMVAISMCIILIFSMLTFVNSSHWNRAIFFYQYNQRFIHPALAKLFGLNYIYVLQKQQFYDEALKEANFLLSINPYDPHIFVVRGDILRAMNRYAEAEEAYKKSLNINPFSWVANQRLKALAQVTGKPYKEEAYDMFEPREAKVLSLIRMGNFQKAFQAIDHELSVAPSSNLYTLAGLTFGQIGEYQKAIDAFNVAIKFNQNNILAIYNLAVAYEMVGQFDKAEQAFRKINQLKKNKQLP